MNYTWLWYFHQRIHYIYVFSLWANHKHTLAIMTPYIDGLKAKILGDLGLDENAKPFTGFRIVVDAGNGAGGFFAERLLSPLGADVTGSRYLEPDGSFPNHQPNPENAEAMQSICDAVSESNADFGIIFDTDVDRAGAVLPTENGTLPLSATISNPSSCTL